MRLFDKKNPKDNGVGTTQQQDLSQLVISWLLRHWKEEKGRGLLIYLQKERAFDLGKLIKGSVSPSREGI